MDVVMNEITSIDDKAEITFGMVKNLFYIYLYNLCITYPNADILLAITDVKAYFCFPFIRPYLTGVFGFSTDNVYYQATGIVLGPTLCPRAGSPFEEQSRPCQMSLQIDKTW